MPHDVDKKKKEKKMWLEGRMLQIKENYKFFVTLHMEMCSLFLYPVESELCNWIYDCSKEYSGSYSVPVFRKQLSSLSSQNLACHAVEESPGNHVEENLGPRL